MVQAAASIRHKANSFDLCHVCHLVFRCLSISVSVAAICAVPLIFLFWNVHSTPFDYPLSLQLLRQQRAFFCCCCLFYNCNTEFLLSDAFCARCSECMPRKIRCIANESNVVYTWKARAAISRMECVIWLRAGVVQYTASVCGPLVGVARCRDDSATIALKWCADFSYYTIYDAISDTNTRATCNSHTDASLNSYGDGEWQTLGEWLRNRDSQITGHRTNTHAHLWKANVITQCAQRYATYRLVVRHCTMYQCIGMVDRIQDLS